MTPQELKDRTKRFATEIVRLCRRLPKERIAVALEEADESQLWLELFSVPELSVDGSLLNPMLKEAAELAAIFTTSYNTAKSNLEKRKY